MPKHLKKEKGDNSSEKPPEVRRDRANAISITDLAKKRLRKPINDEVDKIEVVAGIRITKDSLKAKVKYRGVRWSKVVAVLAGIAGLISTAFKFFKG